MLVIRLSRVGRKKVALYRLVAADKRRAATGKIVARLGHYNPHTKETVINKDAIEKYLSQGAQPSSSAVKLLKTQKVKLPKWAEANLVMKKKQPKKKEEKAEDTPKAEKPTEAADTSKEEVKTDEKAEEKQVAESEKSEEKAEGKPDDQKPKAEKPDENKQNPQAK